LFIKRDPLDENTLYIWVSVFDFWIYLWYMIKNTKATEYLKRKNGQEMKEQR